MKKRALVFALVGWLTQGFVGSGILRHTTFHESLAIYEQYFAPLKESDPKAYEFALERFVDFDRFEKFSYGRGTKSYYIGVLAGPITFVIAIVNRYTHFIGRMTAKGFLGVYGGWQDVKFSNSHWGFTTEWPLPMLTIHAGEKKPVGAAIPFLSPKGWM